MTPNQGFVNKALRTSLSFSPRILLRPIQLSSAGVYGSHRRRAFSSSRLAMTQSKPSDWSASQYLKFGDERTRPVRDLVAQIPLTFPKHVVDLGCGPGNSTEELAARYPAAQIEGVDSSPNMLTKARATLPDVKFTLADLQSYTPSEPVDLFFANAVFQWVPGAERIPVIARLIEMQPSGGVFAFQVPDNFLEPSHAMMRETAANGPWAAQLQGSNPLRDPFPSPQTLYDALKPLCASVDLWHTRYHHILDDHSSIVEWVKGTGLRPYIDPLSDEHREQFLHEYLQRLKQNYSSQQDGKVILTYPRLFMVGIRA